MKQISTDLKIFYNNTIGVDNNHGRDNSFVGTRLHNDVEMRLLIVIEHISKYWRLIWTVGKHNSKIS